MRGGVSRIDRRQVIFALALAGGCSSRPHVGVERDERGRDGGAPAVVVVDRPARPAAGAKRPAVVDFVDEREPDDDLPHAQPLELPKGMRGTIGAPAKQGKATVADVDVFSWLVGGDGKQAARVELSGVPGFTLALDALDGDGQRLTSATDGGEGEGQVIPNLAVEPGRTYFFRVRPVFKKGVEPRGDATHAWQLAVTTQPLAPGDEEEPNDAVDKATPIADAASGLFGRRGDEDWLKLSTEGAAPGSTLRLELGGVEGVQPSLRVADAGGKALAVARGGKGDELRLRNAPLGALVALKAERGFSTENRWSLRAIVEPPLQGVEVEPNDSRETANAVAGEVSGFLWPGDVDHFKVYVDAPSLVTATLEPPERVDAKLELAGDARLRADEGGPGRRESLPPIFVAAGDLVFAVAGHAARDVAFDAPYKLTLAVAPDDGATEREPNDAAATATAIEPDRPVRGFLAPKGDEDWYKVAAPDGATAIRAAADGGPAKALAVKLLDEAKVPLGAATGAGQPASGPAAAGKTYYIVIRDPGGKTSAPAEPYRLTVSFDR